MSAAALRAPAPWHRAARAEATAVLFSRRAPLLLLALALLSLAGGMDDHFPFSGLRQLTLPLLFVPLLLWRGRGVRDALDEALPIGAARYALIRVGVGAAAVVVLLGLVTATHAWLLDAQLAPGQLGGFADSYPAALVIRGLAVYLVGAAIVLRARRPGRVLLALCIALVLAGALALAVLGPDAALLLTALGAESTQKETAYAPDGTATTSFGSSLTLGVALVQLAVAAAVLGASVWLGRRGDTPLFHGRVTRGDRLPTSAAPSAQALRVPRAPAASSVVVGRQLAVLAPRMRWPLALAAVFALWYLAVGMGTLGTAGQAVSMNRFVGLLFFAFYAPLLVWMDERGGRAWDEAQPADTFTRRVAHAAAGLAWLELCVMVLLAGHAAGAVASGTPLSPAWIRPWVMPGVPLAVMALYCVGTMPVVLSNHPVRASLLTGMIFMPALTAIPLILWGTFTERFAWSPLHLLLPTDRASTPWSFVTALVWLPLFVALAVAAIRHGVSRDLHGSTGTASASGHATRALLRAGSAA